MFVLHLNDCFVELVVKELFVQQILFNVATRFH